MELPPRDFESRASTSFTTPAVLCFLPYASRITSYNVCYTKLLRYEMKMDHLKLKLIDSFMKQDERKKNLSNDDYLEKFILEKSDKTVAPKELDKFIADKKMSEEMITAQFKERAREYILMEKRTKALENWLLKKMGEKEGKIFLKKPARPSVDRITSYNVCYTKLLRK